MKSILCLVALTACVALVQAVPEQYRKIVQGCYADLPSPIDDDVRGKLNRHEDIEFTPEVRAFIACLTKSLDSMTQSGETVADRIRAIFKRVTTDEEQLDALVKKCTEKKATPEETIYSSFKCTADYMEKHWTGSIFRLE